MNVTCKEEWMSLFTDAVASAWTKERPELRKLTMLLIAYHLELNRIKQIADVQFQQLRDQYDKIQNYENKIPTEPQHKNNSKQNLKTFNFKHISSSEQAKENIDPDRTKTLLFLTDNNTQSPDIFNVESDNEDFNFLNSKLSKSKVDVCVEDDSPMSLSKDLSPKINKSSNIIRNKLTKYRNSNSTSNSKRSAEESPYDLSNESENNSDDRNFENYYVQEAKKPRSNDVADLNDKVRNNLEYSIIETTPLLGTDLKRSKRPKSSFRQLFSKNKDSKFQGLKNSTLTQMFEEINQNSIDKSTSSILNTENNKKVPENCDNLKNPPIKPIIDESLTTFIEEYDKIPFKKSQSPENNVRGKERKNLKGWSCQDCKKYYEALNLPDDELQEKKDICSRHRGKLKPPDDTPQVFWDLTFPPTQNF